MCHPHCHLARFPFVPPPASSKSKSLATQPSALPTGPHYVQQPTKRCCWEITSQTGKSLTDNVSENGRFVRSVLYQSGEGASAAKPFWLWSLHGKGRYQLGVAPRPIKHLSSSYLLLGVMVQGTTVQYKDSGLVRWIGHLLSRKEIWLQI